MKVFSLLISFLIITNIYGQDSGYFTDLASTQGIEDSVIVLDLVDETITKKLYEFKNLEKLFILSCEIDSIFENIIELKKLQILKIENSKLKFIHPNIFDLPQIKHVALAGNSIKTINFKKNTTLEYLDMSYNDLNRIEGVHSLINLKKIVCKGNHLEIIPCELLSLENLRYFNFSENNKYKKN